ncbi:MAG TPA: transglycosylase SLT domain-containing protein [Candidatus Cybelea sp.]
MSIDPIASRLAENGVAYAPQIARAARQNGLDPNLLAAVAAQETGGPGANSGHNIVGDGGHGRGVFQIDDRWHPFASSPAAMDPASNANYAAGMLSGLLKRYGGNVHEALSAYNSGSPTSTGTKTRWADGSDLGYADSVLRHYQQLSGGASLPSSVQATAAAESPTEVASVGALGAAAQRYPPPAMPAPALTGFAHPSRSQAHPFHRQPTDYVSLFTDTNETDS